MTPLETQRLADTVSDIYNDLEDEILQNIIRHVKAYDQPITSDEWLFQKLGDMGRLKSETIKIIAKASGPQYRAMMQMLNECAGRAIADVAPGFEEMAAEGLIDGVTDLVTSPYFEKTIRNLVKQANDAINLTNTTMLHKTTAAYKKLVFGTKYAEDEIDAAAQKMLSKGTASVVSGVSSRQQALRKTIRELNNVGITGHVDKSGRNWTPEAYVNMCMRSTSSNLATQTMFDACATEGVDLIEVDSHAGARPKCAMDQGKIFSRSGKDKNYPALSSSSYGQPDGLFGINCGHHAYPYIPGVSTRRYFPTEDMEENNRLYKETQVQRGLEREVRKQKRLCMEFSTLEDKEAFEEASVFLKQKEARLKYYVDSHDQLHRRKNREQVVGFDKTVSANAVGKAQTHYVVWAKSIGAETGPKRLAGYYDLMYNKSEESRLYKGYVDAVKKGRISPLVKYDKFKEVYDNAEKRLVGEITSDGQEISGITVHLAERIIGQHAYGDVPKKGKRMGVSIDKVVDALVNGEAGKGELRKDGRYGQKFYGEDCTVSFNPDTKTVIQVSPGGRRNDKDN